MTESKHKLELLKDLLLGNSLEEQRKGLDEEIKALRQRIAEREKLEQNIEPLLEERLVKLKRDFPQHFGPALAKTLEQEIQENPQEMKRVLSPLIQEMVSEAIDERWNGLKSKIGLSRKNTKSPTDLYRNKPEAETHEGEEKAVLNDVFVLENEQLLLLGSSSRYADERDKHTKSLLLKTIREHLKEGLESASTPSVWIDFDTYRIFLISFKRLSIAGTVSGEPSKRFQEKLEDQIMEYAKDVLPEFKTGDLEYNRQMAKRFLDSHFTQW